MAKYFVKKGVTSFGYDGKAYPVVKGVAELPDSPALASFLQEGIITPFEGDAQAIAETLAIMETPVEVPVVEVPAETPVEEVLPSVAFEAVPEVVKAKRVYKTKKAKK